MGLRRHLAALALVGAADAAVRVACLGDSITKGGHGSDEDDDDHADSYPEFLGALLGDGYDVRNYGSSGKTAADYGTDESNPYRETSNWDDALDDGFDIAVVMLGTNDAKEDNWDRDTFVAQYGALLAETKARAAALVALLPVPYVPGDEFSASSKWGDDPSVMNEALPAATLDAFEEDGAAPDVVVSLWDAFGGDDPDLSLYDDAIHPNQKGYERIAATVYAEGLLAVAAGAPTYQPSIEDDASDGDVELVDGGLGDDASDGEVELVRVDEKPRAVDVDVGDDFPDRAPTDSPDTVIHDRAG